MVNATCTRQTRQEVPITKEITEKVQDQGEKHYVFDLAHVQATLDVVRVV